MSPPTSIAFDDGSLDAIADALNERGYAVCTHALPSPLLTDIERRLRSLAADSWTDAGTGRDENHRAEAGFRTDQTVWLSDEDAVESSYLAAMDRLRLGLNQRLFLGLFEYESHFAHYRVGGYYQRHLDALVGRSNRVLSAVLYLNTKWRPIDGGALLLYTALGETPMLSVTPEMGTLVLFFSTRFPHEVAVTRRERLSLAGWFRVNSGGSQRVDPPR